MVRLQRLYWLAYAPFVVTLALAVLGLLSPLTGIGPASNVFALSALAAIALGLAVGIGALFLPQGARLGWRLLIGVMYGPTALMSLLMAGF
ncbi:hypothetical protein [Massilia sp. PWRC2]|uniref:hypothetical protein n=1 Tax=Massilia sp. PWRC2 TaxID=2804626 RepID=UPI003CF34A0B